MLEIDDLRTFRAVVESGSLTKASGLLHLTPGAVSKALSRFEGQLGRTLFDRTGRRLIVNDFGQRLYRLSARLIEEHVRLVAELEHPSTTTHETLRIGSFEVFTTHCLGAALAGSLAGHDVQVLDVGVGAIEDAVRDREVDFGVTYVPFPARDLHFEPIAQIRFGIWGHGPTFRGAPFDELPFAIPVTRLQLAAGELLGIDCWPYDRVARRVRYRLTALESALALARARQCVVFLPDFIGRLSNAVCSRAHQLERFSSPAGVGTVQQTVQLVVREDQREHPMTADVRRAFAAAINGL